VSLANSPSALLRRWHAVATISSRSSTTPPRRGPGCPRGVLKIPLLTAKIFWREKCAWRQNLFSFLAVLWTGLLSETKDATGHAGRWPRYRRQGERPVDEQQKGALKKGAARTVEAATKIQRPDKREESAHSRCAKSLTSCRSIEASHPRQIGTETRGAAPRTCEDSRSKTDARDSQDGQGGRRRSREDGLSRSPHKS
jgi:hypothetical protein